MNFQTPKSFYCGESELEDIFEIDVFLKEKPAELRATDREDYAIAVEYFKRLEERGFCIRTLSKVSEREAGGENKGCQTDGFACDDLNLECLALSGLVMSKKKEIEKKIEEQERKIQAQKRANHCDVCLYRDLDVESVYYSAEVSFRRLSRIAVLKPYISGGCVCLRSVFCLS